MPPWKAAGWQAASWQSARWQAATIHSYLSFLGKLACSYLGLFGKLVGDLEVAELDGKLKLVLSVTGHCHRLRLEALYGAEQPSWGINRGTEKGTEQGIQRGTENGREMGTENGT